MDRFEELKVKMRKLGHFTRLTKEEQDEYSALKRIMEDNRKKPDSNVLTIKKSELEGIVEAMIEQRTKKKVKEDYGKWKNADKQLKQNQTATLKVWQETIDDEPELIIAQDYYKKVWNEEEHKFNKILYKIKLLNAKGDVRDLKVDINVLLEIKEQEQVELIDVDRKELVKKDGDVFITPRDKGGYAVYRADNSYGQTNGTIKVPLEVRKFHEVFTVKRENGQEFKIESKYLNT